MSHRPPRLLERILARVVPDGASWPSVLGDLAEEYAGLARRRGALAAGLWYFGQGVTIGVPYLGWTVRAVAIELMRGLGMDLRYTFRGLKSNPAVTLVAVLSLSLGTGLVTTAGSLINGIWFAALPYDDAHELVDLEDTHPTEVCRGCSPGTSYASFLEWRDGLGVFGGIGAMDGRSANLTLGGQTRQEPIAAVTGNLTALLGLRTLLGRPILPEDEAASAPAVMVLSHGLWETEFGADPSVLGRSVQVDGRPHSIVGVLAPEARALDRSRAWVPLRATEMEPGYDARGLWVIGRLPSAISVDAADAAIGAFASRAYSDDPALETGWSARARPLRDVLIEGTVPPSGAAALMGAAVIVLLLGSVNLAALLLSRVVEREREMGIRLALGSSRVSLIRFVLLEATTLSVVGGLGGLLLSVVAVDALSAGLDGVAPAWIRFPLDVRVLASALGAVALAAMVCGLLPFRRALGARPGQGVIARLARSRRGRLGVRDLLLGTQVVLGVLLVQGGATAVRSFLRVSNFDDIGYRYEGIYTLALGIPEAELTDEDAADALLTRLAERLVAHPSVSRAVPNRSLFLGSWGDRTAPSPVRVEGAEEPVSNEVVPRHSLSVGAGYFDLLQIPLLAGRPILPTDRPGAEPAAVVSVRAGEILWPGEAVQDLPGRRFEVNDGSGAARWYTVVGVSGDVVSNVNSESRRVNPRIYTALSQTPADLISDNPNAGLGFVLALSGPTPVADRWEDWLQAGPGLSVTYAAPFVETLRRNITEARVMATLMSTLSLVALGLLVIGLYGTLSHRISTMKTEIGIRVALGARSGELVRAVSHRIARVLAAAFIVGGVAALVVGRFTAGSVPVGGRDPGLLAIVALVLAVSFTLAALTPLRRALRIDPIESLKTD